MFRRPCFGGSWGDNKAEEDDLTKLEKLYQFAVEPIAGSATLEAGAHTEGEWVPRLKVRPCPVQGLYIVIVSIYGN